MVVKNGDLPQSVELFQKKIVTGTRHNHGVFVDHGIWKLSPLISRALKPSFHNHLTRIFFHSPTCESVSRLGAFVSGGGKAPTSPKKPSTQIFQQNLLLVVEPTFL